MFPVFIAMASPEGGGGGGLIGFLPMILIFGIMYFLILRPQMKRQKEHQKMLSEVAKGDRIVTSGGLHAIIVKVNQKENTLTIKPAENIKLEVDRSAVARKIVPGKDTQKKR